MDLNLPALRMRPLVGALGMSAPRRAVDPSCDMDVHLRRYRLPEEADVLVNTTEREVRGDLAAIRFYPDGSSSGGSIELGAEGVVFQVTVDWLTGAVAVARLGAE